MPDSSSSFTQLGAIGGGSGAVVTTAGLLFIQGAAPAGAMPYWNYDGANLVGNVPTGKGFSLTVGGVPTVAVTNIGTISAGTNGDVTTTNGEFKAGGSNAGLLNTANGSLRVKSSISDAANAVAMYTDTAATLSTSGAMLSQWRNATSARGGMTFDGVVVASGLAVGSFPSTLTSNAMLTGGQAYVRANTTGGAFTITLPDVTKTGNGGAQMIAIKCVATSANALTLKGWGTQTIAGAATMTITPSSVKEGVILFGDGISDWQPLGEFSAAL